MNLADQIIEHGPYEFGSLVLASFASELLQVGPLNQLRDELIEGRKLRAAAEALKLVQVSIGQEEHDTWLELDGPGWADAADTPTTLAELVRRADEHSEECGR